MKTLKPILLFLLATLITSFLPFSGLLMPLFLVLSAGLFVAISVKWNYLYCVFSAAFSGLIIYFTSHFPAELAILLPLISFISATGIFIALKSKSDVKSVLLSGSVAYFLLIIGICLLYGGTFVTDTINIIKTSVIESLDSMAMSLPVDSNEAIAELRNMYNLYFENLKVVAPSLIISLFFLLSYFTIKVSGRIAKSEKLYENIPPFSELRAPVFLLIVAAVSYIGQLSGNGFFAGLMSNIFMALSIYYTLCGFSLVDFFMKMRIKKLYVRIIIYLLGTTVLTLLSFIIYFTNPILIGMVGGMIDSLFNYRAKVRNITGK